MKRVVKKQKPQRRPAFGKHYKRMADMLESDNAHILFSPLINLLGTMIGALALLSEESISGENDAERLVMLAELLDAVAKANTQAREEADREEECYIE